MLLIGIDGGNNTVITTIEGKQPLIIPTVYALYKELEGSLAKKNKFLKDCLDVEIELNFKNNSKRRNMGRYFVGKLAKENVNASAKVRTIGKSKTGDEGLLICMLTSMAASVVEYQSKYTGSLTQDIKIVTGLPFNQYKADREDFIRQFVGSHKVIFRGDFDIEVELNILDVAVEVEGAGALSKLIMDENGEYIYSDEELVDRLILGVEVGEFTSEIIAMEFKEDEDGAVMPQYKNGLCTGIDKGIANAKQAIIEQFRDKYKTIIDRYDIDFAYGRNNRRGSIDIENGEPINITEDYGKQLDSLTENIADMINDRIKDSGVRKGTIKHVLIFGGGSCVLDYRFGNHLKEKIKEVIGSTSSIPDQPHLSNALGYLEKAKFVFES